MISEDRARSSGLASRTNSVRRPPHRWFAAFFAFGAMMSALTIVLLSFPGTSLDTLWRLNPNAYEGFKSIGSWAVVLMTVVGTGCACAAVGLWRGSRWGVPLAVFILAVNLGGDLLNALVRQDYRALIGLPIAGAMIVYLLRAKPAPHFREDRVD